jgi:hypothetical protein
VDTYGLRPRRENPASEDSSSSELVIPDVYLVYDQHRAHTSAICDSVINEYFVPLMLPACSCEFNR